MSTTIISKGSARDPHLVPLQTNYMSKYDFATKYQPEVLPQVISLYGKGLPGFCRMYGATREVSADQFYWGEDGRLRKLEKGVSLDAATNEFTCAENTVQRVNSKIMVMDPATGKNQIGLVTEVNRDDRKKFTAKPYDSASWSVGESGLNVATVGSEFHKGSEPMKGVIAGQQNIYHTSLTISKDTYAINDSDLCNAAWLQAPDGSMYWNHQEIEDFYTRFDDFEELNMLTSVKVREESPLFGEGYNSTSGLFESIRVRGNSISGIPEDLNDWREVIKVLDKEEGEKGNTLFVTSDFSFNIDLMLAKGGFSTEAINWGNFDNKDLALKFGFDAFSLSGYTFYKNTWKTLNDPTGISPENMGASGAIHGIMMPMGTIKAPWGYNSSLSGAPIESINYLTLLYKGGNGVRRNRQTTLYGARVQNGREDITGVDVLSESGLVLAGANRWGIFEGQ